MMMFKTKKKVPRISTINTVEGYRRAENELKAICGSVDGCEHCRYLNATSLVDSCMKIYLLEEIEVDE